MDPLNAAVKGFRAEFRAFRHHPTARVLRVLTDPENANLLLQVVSGEEWAPDNRRPFVITGTPSEEGFAHFHRMSEQVRRHYEALRARFQGDVDSLPPFGEVADGAWPGATLAANVYRFAERTAGALEPPLLCWMPGQVHDAAGYRQSAVALARIAAATDARVVIYDRAGRPWLDGVLAEFGEQVATTAFAVDNEALGDYFRRLMLAPPSAGRAPGAFPGAAAPDVAPPPRPGPPPPTPEQVRAALEEAGLPPVLTPSAGERLRELVVGAAAALGDRRRDEALAQQYAAYELCAGAGVRIEQAMMALVLAGYLVQCKRPDDAEKWFGEAARVAEGADAHAQAAQARLGLGYLLLQRRRAADAAKAYEAGAAAAAAAGSVLLFLEAQRMAGRCHAQREQDGEAIRCWTAGVEAGSEAPVGELDASCFGAVMSDLKALLWRLGMREEYQRIHAIDAAVEARRAAAGAAS